MDWGGGEHWGRVVGEVGLGWRLSGSTGGGTLTILITFISLVTLISLITQKKNLKTQTTLTLVSLIVVTTLIALKP